MFGMGSIGNLLPMIGSIGSGFGGGGLLSLGFTLLSGLLGKIGSPSNFNPGFNMDSPHPGFNIGGANSPGFGSISGGPNLSTFGQMTGYFGSAFSGGDNGYSILPQTPSGQYFGNQGYSWGNNQTTYAQTPPPQFGGHQPMPYQMPYLNFGGNFSQYQHNYGQLMKPQQPFYPSYQHGQTQATYGSAPAPSNQSYSPVVHHYGFGAPQQYNPAATLFGHQHGSVQLQYGQPEHRTNYGGPQNGQTVHHHHHLHIHVHDHTQPEPTNTDYSTPPVAQEPAPETPAYEPEPTPDPAPAYEPEPTPEPTPPATDYGTQPEPVADTPTDDYNTEPVAEPEPTYGGEPTTPDYPANEPVAYEPDPAPVPAYTPEPAYEPQPAPVDHPAEIVETNHVAAQQTAWGRVPHVNTDSQWAYASTQVADRITGGDHTVYSFGGRDPRGNQDGRGNERNATWHVFQQNESLRLDMESGYFYETAADGSTTNKFHMSAVADLERQAGGDRRRGFELVGDFLNQRGLLAEGLAVGGGTNNNVNTQLVNAVAEQKGTSTTNVNGTAFQFNSMNLPGSTPQVQSGIPGPSGSMFG